MKIAQYFPSSWTYLKVTVAVLKTVSTLPPLRLPQNVPRIGSVALASCIVYGVVYSVQCTGKKKLISLIPIFVSGQREVFGKRYLLFQKNIEGFNRQNISNKNPIRLKVRPYFQLNLMRISATKKTSYKSFSGIIEDFLKKTIKIHFDSVTVD